jgi:hypothetical protein
MVVGRAGAGGAIPICHSVTCRVTPVEIPRILRREAKNPVNGNRNLISWRRRAVVSIQLPPTKSPLSRGYIRARYWDSRYWDRSRSKGVLRVPGDTICSKRSGPGRMAGGIVNSPTAPSSGQHPTGRLTPPHRAVGCCSRNCANPPHPSPPPTCPPSRATPRDWRCHAARGPAPKTGPAATTTNANSTKPQPHEQPPTQPHRSDVLNRSFAICRRGGPCLTGLRAQRDSRPSRTS